jgi:hypothetical protein
VAGFELIRFAQTRFPIPTYRRRLIVLVFRKTVLDCDVAAFNVAGFTQATTERFHKVGPVIPPQAGQEADDRHRRLLRARR